MAADLIMNPETNHTSVHDLEPAFYVIFWLSIRLLANTWSEEVRLFTMEELFNPDAFENVVFPSKLNWMARARTNMSSFEVIGNPVLTNVLLALAELFETRLSKISGKPETQYLGQSLADGKLYHRLLRMTRRMISTVWTIMMR